MKIDKEYKINITLVVPIILKKHLPGASMEVFRCETVGDLIQRVKKLSKRKDLHVPDLRDIINWVHMSPNRWTLENKCILMIRDRG